MNAKRERVQRMIDILKENWNEFPRGEIFNFEDTGQDPPDIVIEHPTGKRIGIEVTEHFHIRGEDRSRGSEAQAAESEYAKITDDARNQYIERGHSPLMVGLIWKDYKFAGWSKPSGSRKSKITTELVDMIAKYAPHALEEERSLYSKDFAREYRLLSSHLYNIFMRASNVHEWARVTSTEHSILDRRELVRIVRAKEQKPWPRRDEFNESWLMIMYETSASSYVNLGEDVAEGTIQSQFNRVILYSPFWKPKRIIQLTQ